MMRGLFCQETRVPCSDAARRGVCKAQGSSLGPTFRTAAMLCILGVVLIIQAGTAVGVLDHRPQTETNAASRTSQMLFGN